MRRVSDPRIQAPSPSSHLIVSRIHNLLARFRVEATVSASSGPSTHAITCTVPLALILSLVRTCLPAALLGS